MTASVDVVIITAAEGEDTALLEVSEGALSPWARIPSPEGYASEVYRAAFESLATPGRAIHVVMTRPPRMRGDLAANAAGLLVGVFKPRCLAMCGVCAGRPGWTELGDVIVGERVWRYDAGGRVNAVPEGRPVLKKDTELFQLSAEWLRAAQNAAREWKVWPARDTTWLQTRPRPRELQALWLMKELAEGRAPVKHPEVTRLCASWKDVVERLMADGLVEDGDLTEAGRKHLRRELFKHKRELPEQAAWAVHLGPIGTGNDLVEDVDIWQQLELKQRLVIGFEMELAAIGASAWASGLPFLAVKGVMDYGLPDRHCDFRPFAARASAEVLVRLLRTVVEPSSVVAEESKLRERIDNLGERSRIIEGSDDRERARQALTNQGTTATAPPPLDFPEYRRDAVQRHRTVRLAGFNEQVRVSIDLEGLYVELDVMLDHGRADRMVFTDAEHARKELLVGTRSQRMPLAKAFGLARAFGKRGMAMLGDPGSGKTTELRRALLSVLSDAPGRGPEAMGLPAGTLPVFLPLRNLRPRESLESFMQRELDDETGGVEPELAKRLLRRGSLLLLLDGLDEVADEGERGKVARWIERLCAKRSDYTFLVSSRFAGYVPDVRLDANFLELHLRAMRPAQVRRFVQNWYKTVEAAEAELEQRLASLSGSSRKPSAVEDEENGVVELLADFRVPEEDHAEATHLLARFDEPAFVDAQVYAMTTNPLLLTAICLVHRRHGGVLPGSRERLLHECTSVLLEGWRKRGKELPVVLPAEQAIRVLQPVALWMHGQDGRTQASAAELAVPVATGFESIRRPGVDANELLRRIRDESGLLTGWGLDRYGFMHLGFQEYLAALELRRRGVEGRGTEAVDGLRALAGRFGETWWREVILLMLAHGDVRLLEQLMGHVAAQPELEAWTRSAMMSRVLGQYDREALAGLDDVMLGHASLGVRTWWRRVRGLEARAVALDMKVENGVELVLVPGGRFLMGSPKDDEQAFDEEKPQHEVELKAFWMARTPVTNAQYGEYMKAKPWVQEPDHWADSRYNQPQQAVVGVSWVEAKAYCAWAGLSLPTEAQWEYACRAGTTTQYSAGDSEKDLRKVGWYSGNSEGELHAVAELEPNGWGLYDMHGNVWEWCKDTWVSDYKGAE